MKVGRNAPCPCGSGRKYKLCHGQTRDQERALRLRDEALEEAGGLGAMLPALRPVESEALRFADRVAAEIGADDDVPVDVLDRGLELVGEGERKRLVAGYTERFEPLWEELCEQIGARDLTARAFVRGVVQATIEERRAAAPSARGNRPPDVPGDDRVRGAGLGSRARPRLGGGRSGRSFRQHVALSLLANYLVFLGAAPEPALAG